MSPVDLKQFVATSAPMFDDPEAASREAFAVTAVILAAGEQSEQALAGFATYLGWSPPQVRALADGSAGFRTTAPPTLRRLVAAGHGSQVRAYALFLVQVTRLACLQFAPHDAGALRAAGAIAATITRAAPISNTQLEPAAPSGAPAPVGAASGPDTEAVGRALDDLEALVGLETVKREINQQVQLIRIAQLRRAQGLKNPTVSRHLVFVGNPGTGKTTVARIVGRIYAALGVVQDGHLVETDAAGLVAGYVGQTALKTKEQIDCALGGILFIDEAYGLIRNDFGSEAIDTLVKGMEDHRQDLVVIVAGYTANMSEFIAANPGLQSRFPTTIEFADYTPAQLLQILTSMCRDNDYTLAPEAHHPVLELFTVMATREAFGNARTVRNVFEAAVGLHAWRLRDISEPTAEQIRVLTTDDILGAAAEHP